MLLGTSQRKKRVLDEEASLEEATREETSLEEASLAILNKACDCGMVAAILMNHKLQSVVLRDDGEDSS
jgi:hypothetical protein